MRVELKTVAIFCIAFLAFSPFAQFVNNGIQEICENYVKETPNTQVFLFTDSFKSCPDEAFATQYQLNCTQASAQNQYMRIAVRTPAAPANESYVKLSLAISYVGTASNPCYLVQDSSDCNITPCNEVSATLDLGIITTRVYVKYTLNFQGYIPYSYFPVDSNTPIVSPTCSGLAACQCAEDNPNDIGPCTVTDPLNIAANCGANTDPDNGYSSTLNKLCTSICCSACNLDPASQHRRWAVDPVCSVYTISGPQLVTDVYVAADNNGNAHRIEAYVEANNLAVQDTFVGISDNADYPVKGNIIRLYGNKVYSGAQSNVPVMNGLIILCDYGNITGGMGPYNPYVTLEPDVEVPFSTKTFTIKNGRFRTPPYNASPVSLGAGKVPTINSMNLGVSMFYINSTMAPLFAQLGLLGYVQGQPNVLNNYKTQNAEYEPPAWWTAYTGVPGWQLSTAAPIVPMVPSPCQMANSINTYAINYNAAVAGNGGDYEAAIEQAGDISPYLPPNFRIDKPNWWSNGGKELYFDIGTVLTTQQPTFEFYVDIIQAAITPLKPKSIIDITQQSTCIANLTSGNGTAIAYLYNTLQDNSMVLDLYLQCNYTLVDPTTNTKTVYPANVTMVEKAIPVAQLQTQISAPFPFTFSNQTTEAPVCIFIAVEESTKPNPPIYTSQFFSCLLTLNPNINYVTIINSNSTTPSSTTCASCDWGCWKDKGMLMQQPCFWIPVSVILTFFIVFAIIMSCCICGCCRKNKK